MRRRRGLRALRLIVSTAMVASGAVAIMLWVFPEESEPLSRWLTRGNSDDAVSARGFAAAAIVFTIVRIMLGEWLVKRPPKDHGLQGGEVISYAARASFEPRADAEFIVRVEQEANAWLTELFGNDEVDKKLSELVVRLTAPAASTIRINRTVSIHRTHLTQRTSSIVQKLTDGVGIVPALKLPKGQLCDKLKILYNDKTCPSLSHDVSHGTTLLVLDSLLDAALKSRVPDGVYTRLRGEALRLVADDGAADVSQTSDLIRGVNSSAEASGIAPEDDELVRLCEFLSFATRNYIIYADVTFDENDNTGKLTTEHEVRIADLINSDYNWFRLLFDLEPRHFMIPLAEAAETKSIHLQCAAPKGMYVYSQRILLIKTPRLHPDTDNCSIRNKSDRPLLAGSDCLGLDYVHAYGRDLESHLSELSEGDTTAPGSYDVHPVVDVEFRERPPGLMLPLLVSSLILATLVLIVGNNFDDLLNVKSGTGTDIVSVPISTIGIIFGLPAVLAGWTIARISEDSLRRISIPTAICSVWFVVNAVCALVVVAVPNLRLDGDAPSTWWILFTVSCFAHLFHTLLLYVNRSSRYIRRLRLSQSDIDGIGSKV